MALPIANAAVDKTGADRLKMSFIVMLAASDYITSFGYQTNLMVYGPGEYSNLDFLRFGAPMQVLLWLSSTAMVSTSTSETWFISWIICFIGFAVVVFVRLMHGNVAQFMQKRKFNNGIHSIPPEETNKLNNSWHFRREKDN